jgi:tRNA nucleotidyltransferase (CCA-adding enzyme)
MRDTALMIALPSPQVLLGRWRAGLSQAVGAAIDRLIEGLPVGADLYAAGGTVRDLLRGEALTRDIDLVSEADAIELAHAAWPGRRMTTHARFRTVSAGFSGTRIDLVTARRETYERPGALPKVLRADLAADMRRRDFSMNAVALRITGSPELIDPCGGVADIERRRVKVLHDGSFRDDATRIFRAYRYASRLDFEIEPHTRELIEASLAFVAAVSPERVRREFELLFADRNGGAALDAMDASGVLRAVHGALRWSGRCSEALSRERDSAQISDLGFALLASAADVGEAEQVIARLRLKRGQAAAVHGVPALRASASLLRRGEAKPSGVAILLDRYPVASIAAFAALSDDSIAGSLALSYLGEWRDVRPTLRGDDLIELGVPEGPQVEQGLKLIRAAKLDGTARDVADERVLALRFARSIKDSKAASADVAWRDNGHR